MRHRRNGDEGLQELVREFNADPTEEGWERLWKEVVQRRGLRVGFTGRRHERRDEPFLVRRRSSGFDDEEWVEWVVGVETASYWEPFRRLTLAALIERASDGRLGHAVVVQDPSRRSNPDPISELKRAWDENPADTSASRAYFRALLRTGELPTPDSSGESVEHMTPRGQDATWALQELFSVLDEPEVLEAARELRRLDPTIQRLSREGALDRGDEQAVQQWRSITAQAGEARDLIRFAFERVSLSRSGPSWFAAKIPTLYVQVVDNLRRRLTEGVYDHAGAVKAFGKVVARASITISADRHAAQGGNDPWNRIFPPFTRREFAEWLTKRFEARWATGFYDDWTRPRRS